MREVELILSEDEADALVFWLQTARRSGLADNGGRSEIDRLLGMIATARGEGEG